MNPPDYFRKARGKEAAFRVIRNCCTSGNCDTCTRKTPWGTKTRVVQAEGFTAQSAAWVAANWKDYSPTIEAL